MSYYRPIAFTVLLFCCTYYVAAGIGSKSCHGHQCHPVEEYCSAFNENCDKCENICELSSHNFNANLCSTDCSEYNKYIPLKAEIHVIYTQQSIMLILLIALVVLIAIRYIYKCLHFLRHKRCVGIFLKKLYPNAKKAQNNKDQSGTTIQNVMTINEAERPTSQIYSVTGAEGSVITMTTPVSTRHPAENSTTPTSAPNEYSYDNQALSVTPVSEKPSGTHAFE